jgi:hypothetical protein
VTTVPVLRRVRSWRRCLIRIRSQRESTPPDPHGRAQNPPLDSARLGVEADTFWRSDWRYLATSEVQPIDAIKADVKGLALPKPVIDKIYYANARRVFGRPPRQQNGKLRTARLAARRFREFEADLKCGLLEPRAD